ncbi:serine/threonine-protein kinase [Rheinheimera maricola]|uniref:Serine/threonine-protein kinase n=1 Tax=Rheinheimera maricola TaxID=2793282 RepID=A0ABS7X8V7_9GAMM|nr:serine/threonine-protein kinase [Rheinheimera maricola]MBZ9611981.1 serine/threonine-protein kinase [Rheinheimera maricola]
MNLFQLYLDAAALPDANAQQRFIDALAEKSALLADKLKALLADTNHTLHLADDIRHAASRLQQLDISSELTGKQLGYWQLDSIIAHGGMSTVYLASRQDGQFEQQVAIKVLNPLIYPVTPNSQAFAEANVAAKLNHPGITKVFDAGITEHQGQQAHYIVMEYIEGQPLNRWLENTKPPVKTLVRLFIELCDALHYAHTHQIIHADLKPENILVDEHGKPKLIDFGIARLQQQSEQAPAYVQHYVKALSHHYASPEQLSGEPLTTLSDVYSVGKVLQDALALKAYQNKLQTLELNMIIGKALATFSASRYLSMRDLQADLIAITENKPISLALNTRLYKVRKFISRQPAISALMIVAVLSVCAGITGTTLGIIEATTQRDIAEQAKTMAEQKAQELEKVVTFQSSQLKSINPKEMGQYLSQLTTQAIEKATSADNQVTELTLLQQINFTDIGLELIKNTIFDKSISAINEQFAAEPDTQASLLHSTAITLNELSLHEAANTTFKKVINIQSTALGENHRKTLNSQAYLAEVFYGQRKNEDAKALIEQTLLKQRASLAKDDTDILQSLNIYGLILTALGELKDAEKVLEEGLHYSEKTNSPFKLNFYNNLSTLYYQTGETEKALVYLGLVRSEYKAQFGEENPLYLTVTINYAAFNHRNGKSEYAKTLFEENQAALEKVLGNKHINTLLNRANFATLLHELDESDRSITLFRKNLEDGTPVLGEAHNSVALWHDSLGAALYASGQLDEAEKHYRHALSQMKTLRGETHSVTLSSQVKLARLLIDKNQYDEASMLVNEAKTAIERTGNKQSRLYLDILNTSGVLLRRMEKHDESLAEYTELLKVYDGVVNKKNWQLGLYKLEFGLTLKAIGKKTDAQIYITEAREQFVALFSEHHRLSKRALVELEQL